MHFTKLCCGRYVHFETWILFNSQYTMLKRDGVYLVRTYIVDESYDKSFVISYTQTTVDKLYSKFFFFDR